MKKLIQFLCLLAGLGCLTAAPTEKSRKVKVLSFNIRHGEDNWGDSNLRTVIQLIREEKPQLVAFQAIDSIETAGKIRFQLRQIAMQTGMYFSYGASDVTEGGSQGVGILSAWPIEKTQKLVLPGSPGSDPRVLLCGLIRESEKLTFRFCNARLEYASVIDRALQAAYINQLLGESIQPVILTMDMGVKPNEQPYFSFRKNWLDVAKGSQLATWVEGLPGDRLDYILVLNQKRVRVSNYKVIRDYPEASDHYPIVATVEFL